MTSSTQQVSANDAIGYLLERPTEPVFNRRGADGRFQFVLPDSYYAAPYTKIINEISTKADTASEVYHVKELSAKELPDLSLAMSLPLKESFSVFNDFHRECGMSLVEILLNAKTKDEFVSLSAYAKDRVNHYLYVYAISMATLHHPLVKDITLSSHLQIFPELYIDRSLFSTAREENDVVPEGSRMVLEVSRDYTASNLDLEHRVAYFREDVGVNLHHWHWHLVYPSSGRPEIANKDRRGELFYYMHQQLLARYNMERLCNNLARVRRLTNFYEPIEEGYYPKLDNSVASRAWPSRHPFTKMSNVNREKDHLQVDIQDLERWRDRLFEAIHNGRYLNKNGGVEQFRVENGIDILGNLVESNVLSINRTEYGNLHNQGHNLISYIHDPENLYLENFSVMGDSSTAMRDPVFYRWHAYINYMFEQYKHTLPPYTKDELIFTDIQVTDIQITSNGIPNNQIFTFWQQADIDLSKGLDFAEQKGSIFARITHLQHAPFQYNITVQNGGQARIGTVRIFYAPKYDETGVGMQLRYQKSTFVELDRFTYNFQRGKNVIMKQSTDSSVTIPYNQTFRNLSNKPTAGTDKEKSYNFCGCGWPQHMLISKGTINGFVCELFVMISDYQYDKVDGVNTKLTCDDASSYCGLRDSKYPDKRAMGFPFDRLPRAEAVTLKQFITPNMFVQDIKVVFTERIVAPIQQGQISQNQQNRPGNRMGN